MTRKTAPTKTFAAAATGARLMATALAAGIFAVVLIFVIFGYYYDVSQSRLRRAEVEKYLQTVSSSTAWGIDNWLISRVKLAEEVAHHMGEAAPGADLADDLRSPVYEERFMWTYYGEADGAYHIWPPDDTLPADYDPRARPWYEDAVAAGQATLTEPYFDITTNIETITVAVPVFKNRKLAGVVGADFSTESLSDVLMSTDLGGLGYAFLVTGGGKIIAHPDRMLVSKTLADAYPSATPRMDDSIQYLDGAAAPQIVRFVRIPSLDSVDWRLAIAIDKNKAFASLQEFRNQAVIATVAAALLMIVVLGYVIHRLLVWPLLRARVAADAASAAKSEFLASMSHEIRTPMNGVLGMAEVLLNSDLNDHQRELASIIVSSGQALMTVINDILDFSKLEAGKLRLTPRSFNLRQTVYEIATMMQARALEKDLELIVRYAPNLPEGVVADEARLRQVLGNLIGNAVKFTDKGHVLIDISGERAGEAMNIQASITDTGIGIEPAEIPRMFEKFEQADGSHTRRHGGTGLGLAICKNIIELMQGEIGADSEPDKGSRFWFRITAPVDGKVKAIPAIAEAVFDNVRLLAVDDNAVNRRVIDELTNGWGLRATTVGGAKEAMAALERSIAESDRYHAVLMDYQMPGEDGVALTRRIQADPRFAAIPVIMLSSIDPTHAGAGVKEVRLAAHLHKPVRPSQLMDILARVLLDRAATTLTRAARALKNEPERVRDVSSGDRVKVLLAEDNVVNQLVIQNMIGAEEYEVIVAENGQAAVDLFLKHKPSVVLMDISMPVMDGLEAARRIRDIESEQGLHRTPIIAATAHVLEQDRERCRLAGMDDFLAKPIRKPKLDEAVSRWARHAARAPRARSA